MQTITYLKSGKFSIHPARGPIVMCKKGETAELPEDQAKVLEDAGWADIEEVPEEIVEDDNDDPVVPPWEQEEWDPDAEDAKDIIEAYALGTFEVDIDKRKSIAKIIEQLEDLKELTGDN